jgi:[ribosomal protein S18]-alanine N-acetyltransferase
MSTMLGLRPQFATMSGADLDEVLALEARIHPFPWTRGNFGDSLESGHSAWLMKQGGVLIGYAVMMQAADEAQLLNISIAPERRREGHGSALLLHLFAVARQSGAHRMFLEVRSSNASGLALYRRHGFTPIGERRGYYPAQQGREDALVLAREL